MKVLMGIHELELSGIVTKAVVTQLRAENSEILVLYVLQPVEPVAPPEMSQGYVPELDDQREQAQALGQQTTGQLRAAGFKAEIAVEVGDPMVRILEAASEWKADLIVVGWDKKKGIRNLLRGSVSESVARDAKCSVEIVRELESN